MFNVNEIRELVRMVDRSSIGELTIKTDKNHEVTIKKNQNEVTNVQTVAPVQETVTKEPKVESKSESHASEEKSVQNVESKEEAVAIDQDLHKVVSPMVGVFYSAPSPEEPDFVQKGDVINENKVVCIVEAMKLFNEIEAEVNGEIVEILIKNGELVEYGQPLFLVKKN